MPSWRGRGGFASEHSAPFNDDGKDSQQHAKGWDHYQRHAILANATRPKVDIEHAWLGGKSNTSTEEELRLNMKPKRC